eukprot:scaffold6784_cov108-Cylindrotheca_fusiformis.AAC.8
MTIRTPFYFVICAGGGDDSAPQPFVDAMDYYSSCEDDDEDACSSTFTDHSDDSMTYDDCDLDLDLDLDIALPSLICDDGSLFIPAVENHLSLIPGFEEWDEAIEPVITNDLDTATPTGTQMNRIDVITNDSNSFVPTESSMVRL